MPAVTDTLLIYARGADFTYNPEYSKLSEEYVREYYRYTDQKGRYRLDGLTAAMRQGYSYEYKGYRPNLKGWMSPMRTMEKLDAEGLIHFPKSKDGRLRLKTYLHNSRGIPMGNLWDDLPLLAASANGRVGYPTQKPTALTDRIVKMFSDEGDVVLDAFCGSGTTLVSAQRLGRKFLGIDQSEQAIAVSRIRLEKERDLFSPPFEEQRYEQGSNNGNN
jgi:adenine specific DNA methylase Mod